MKKKLTCLLFFCLFNFFISNLFAWDRYSNESSTTTTGHAFQHVVRYYFNVSSSQTVTFETKDGYGDTYMYLWSRDENKQLARNDDGGVGLFSKISYTLKPGNYIIFIRSYSRNNAGFCSLYKNGVRVLYNVKFSGYKLWVGNYDAETRFTTTNLSSGSDTFCLLTNNYGDLIGYDDDGGPGLGSRIVAAESPYFLIIGSYSPYSEGTANVTYERDDHVEYLALAGTETRHAVSGNSFISQFNSGSYYYSNVLSSRDWMFLSSRMNWVNGVDLVFISAHGAIGGVQTSEGGYAIDFTRPEGSAGSGTRTNNNSGDLEYIAFMSCQTVRIESETSWDWIISRGWKSSSTNKGFFDGLHIVVGYHSNHTNSTYSFDNDSSYYEAKFFGYHLDSGMTIWDSWKYANQKATDIVHRWIWRFGDDDLGEISSIYIVPQQNERLSDFKSTDYKYGDYNYNFGWRKRHYWYD